MSIPLYLALFLPVSKVELKSTISLMRQDVTSDGLHSAEKRDGAPSVNFDLKVNGKTLMGYSHQFIRKRRVRMHTKYPDIVHILGTNVATHASQMNKLHEKRG